MCLCYNSLNEQKNLITRMVYWFKLLFHDVLVLKRLLLSHNMLQNKGISFSWLHMLHNT